MELEHILNFIAISGMTMYASSCVCSTINKYVSKKSVKFTSMEDLEKVLPEEKRKLGIEDYNIFVRKVSRYEKSSCENIDDYDFLIRISEGHFNLGTLRHELRHVKHDCNVPILYHIKYLLYDEPSASLYSLIELKKDEKRLKISN